VRDSFLGDLYLPCYKYGSHRAKIRRIRTYGPWVGLDGDHESFRELLAWYMVRRSHLK